MCCLCTMYALPLQIFAEKKQRGIYVKSTKHQMVQTQDL